MIEIYNVFAIVFKYIFIVVIYLFLFSIIRLIYLDIRSIGTSQLDSKTYLKLMNKKDRIAYKINEYYPIRGDISLGRENSNTIRLDDPYISKKHFEISRDGSRYYLEDLESANGTYVNEKPVTGICELNRGDIIRVGKIEFLFVNEE